MADVIAEVHPNDRSNQEQPMKESRMYQEAKNALREHIKEVARYEKLIAEGRDPDFGLFRGITDQDLSLCGMCRMRKKGISRLGDMCKSCLMRKSRPRFLLVQDGALVRWRESVCTQSEFARLCGWSQPRQAYMEAVPVKVRLATARVLASVFVYLGSQGKDLQCVMREWPLFPLLVDQERVNVLLARDDDKNTHDVGSS